jgi:hypothetical protein
LGDAIVARFLADKGQPVRGTIEYDRRRNQCDLATEA